MDILDFIVKCLLALALLTMVFFFVGIAENVWLPKENWHCTKSELVGEVHNKKSVCVQYSMKGEASHDK